MRKTAPGAQCSLPLYMSSPMSSWLPLPCSNSFAIAKAKTSRGNSARSIGTARQFRESTRSCKSSIAKGESKASSRLILALAVVLEYILSTSWASLFSVVTETLEESSRFAKSVRAVATSALVNAGLWKWLKNQ